MNSVTVALQQLQLALTEEFADAPGLTRLCVGLTLSDASDPLSWLSCQRLYPQFYWQQRAGDDEVAAIGSLRQFGSLTQAQDFLDAHTQMPSLRIWGLNGFDSAQGFLFLSRLEWRRKGGEACLWLHLYSRTSLREDAREAAEFLEKLLPAKPLQPLHLKCLGEQHSLSKVNGITWLTEPAMRLTVVIWIKSSLPAPPISISRRRFLLRG